MESRTRYGFGRRLSASVAVCAAGAGAVMWLSPGGLGDADRKGVTGGASVSVYRGVTDVVAGAPSWAGALLEVATAGTLVALGLLLLWTGSSNEQALREAVDQAARRCTVILIAH
ncbi:hypothetical protein ABZ554_11555, partial [Streptomyces sp. NPDC020125]